MNRTMVLLALACLASPVIAEKARVDFDHGRKFSSYKTYSWAPAPGADSADVLFPNQLMRERIQRFVDEALAARRLKRVEKGGDIVVDYHLQVSMTPQFTTFTNSFGSGCCWGWDNWGSAISTTTVDPIYLGTLIVDLRDAHQQQLVFQGVATENISSKPERNTRRLNRAVNRIFEKYPPQP